MAQGGDAFVLERIEEWLCGLSSVRALRDHRLGVDRGPGGVGVVESEVEAGTEVVAVLVEEVGGDRGGPTSGAS